MFLKLIRVRLPDFAGDPKKREGAVINTDKIRTVSKFGDVGLRIELDGREVVYTEALLDDFISIVGAQSLPMTWDDQR